MAKEGIKMPEDSKYVGKYAKFKDFERQIKPPFIIYTDFESTLVPENNGKLNPDESYTNKYQKHVACSYGFK